MGLLMSVALTVMAEAEAQACSCGRQIIGAGRLYLGAGGVLPLDAPGFPWTGPESIAGTTDRVKVVRVEGKRRVPVKYTVTDSAGVDIIKPANKFKPGQVYEVTVRESAGASESRQYVENLRSLPPAEVTTRVTIAAAPLRLTQASLHTGPQTEGGVTVAAPGSCWEGFGAAKVPLRVELPPELEPMRDYLGYMTRIDGRTWDMRSNLCASIDPGRSWTGEPGTDMVFAVCDVSEEAIARVQRLGGQFEYPKPGRHSLEMVVFTLDQTQRITTPAITVEFTCAPPEVAPAPPVEEAPAPVEPSAPPEPSEPPEPPALEHRGCAVGEPGFAWVLGVVWWLGRRRRSPRSAATTA